MNSPFQKKAINIVYAYAASRLDVTDKHITFGPDEVYVVWFSKTLQNWKALLSTTLPDGKYYEVTYDGDRQRTYLDVYTKTDNLVIEDSVSPGGFTMKSVWTNEKIDAKSPIVPDIQKEYYKGDSDDLESMIPVVMGEGADKQRIGEVYNWEQTDEGVRVAMKLDDGTLAKGLLPGPIRKLDRDDVLDITNFDVVIQQEAPYDDENFQSPKPQVNSGPGYMKPMKYSDTENGEA
jgi:hypothetical protein